MKILINNLAAICCPSIGTFPREGSAAKRLNGPWIPNYADQMADHIRYRGIPSTNKVHARNGCLYKYKVWLTIIGCIDHKSLSYLSQLLDLINRSCLSICQHSVFYKSHKGILLLCQVTCVRVIYAQSLFPPASVRLSVSQSVSLPAALPQTRPSVHLFVGWSVIWVGGQSVGWICQSVSLCEYAYLPACLLFVSPAVCPSICLSALWQNNNYLVDPSVLEGSVHVL